MIFNSLEFILFFIVVVALYFSIPHRVRWVLLLAASYIFYMAWRAELIVLILFSTLVNYWVSHQIYRSDGQKKKNLLILSLVVNFGLLLIFKYFMFLSDSAYLFMSQLGLSVAPSEFDIILPMGISFYTFQAAAYTIDVYRGQIAPVKNYGKFSLFITFFPQLVAGPIERSKNLIPQFDEVHHFDLSRMMGGLKLMAWGFFQKVVIADRIAVCVNTIYGDVTSYSGLTFVLASTLFAFQIYCDFGGYSHIAMGAAKVLGFDLMKNFDRPFLSKDIREFWKRWHVSLSSWFMDYLYIPLGGSRHGFVKKQRNLLITFALSGLWHGANWTYLVWGMINGVFIIFENVVDKLVGKTIEIKVRVLSNLVDVCKILFTFAFFVFSVIFFRANSLQDGLYIVEHLLWGFRQWLTPQYLYETITNLGLNLYEIKVIFLSICILMGAEILLGEQFHQRLFQSKSILNTAFFGVLVGLILTWGVFYNAGTFIYFQF